MTTSRRWAAAALALAAALSWGQGAAAQGLRPCPKIVVIDTVADPGVGSPAGAVIDVDLDLPVDANTAIAGGSDVSRFLSHAAVGPDRVIYLSDLEADPSGLGPDPRGNPGRGAVFVMDPLDGALSLVADGTLCGGGITNCGAEGVFVDPVGVAWSDDLQLLAVVDPETDPSGHGADSFGFTGHGAVLSVDPSTGAVDLVADGSLYSAPIPGGRPSIFEDPVAIAFGRGPVLYVADQLARPLGGGSTGAVFAVDVATGAVTLVAYSSLLRGLRDVAVETSGTLLVVARLVGNGGTLFRIDPSLPADSNVVGALNSPEFADLSGVVAEGNGGIFLLDASSDPLATEAFGAVFAVDPTLATATVASSTRDYVLPWSLDLVEPLSLDSAAPPSGNTGSSLTVILTGGPFEGPPSVDFGSADITVDSVTLLSATTLLVDITISAGAVVGYRDVTVTNTNRAHAFHCDLFEVLGGPPCPPQEGLGNTLRASKPGPGLVRLQWTPPADSCFAGAHVRRAFTAVPAALPGDWPVDPAFADVSGEDMDGTTANDVFVHVATPGTAEYYLVVPVGTDGSEGPSGHYGG